MRPGRIRQQLAEEDPVMSALGKQLGLVRGGGNVRHGQKDVWGEAYGCQRGLLVSKLTKLSGLIWTAPQTEAVSQLATEHSAPDGV